MLDCVCSESDKKRGLSVFKLDVPIFKVPPLWMYISTTDFTN